MTMEMAAETTPKPVQLIFDNREALKAHGVDQPRYTPPGGKAGHYLSMYKWDSCRTAEILAEFDYIAEATQELDSILEVMDPVSGFIPNMTRHVKRPAWKEAEWMFFKDKKYSSYTQPPMEAQTAMAIYNAYERTDDTDSGINFLSERYGKLKLSYDYFKNYRQSSPEDPLIVSIHSNETGRDSCPTFDSYKIRLPRNGVETAWIINGINPSLDYLSSLNNARKNHRMGWDIQKIREHFAVKDVMFNCLYQKNLLEMSKIAGILGKEEDMVDLQALADKVEQQILLQMWDPNARNGEGSLFALDKDRHVHETSAANLYPLLLPNLPTNQLKSCLDMIQTAFNTPFPLPTVATDSPNFDPHYKEKGVMWRGPIWQWINKDIKLGLRMQASRADIPEHLVRTCRDIADWIEERSEELVEGSPQEFHDPYTGEGYRTENFAGAASGWRIPESILLKDYSTAGLKENHIGKLVVLKSEIVK